MPDNQKKTFGPRLAYSIHAHTYCCHGYYSCAMKFMSLGRNYDLPLDDVLSKRRDCIDRLVLQAVVEYVMSIFCPFCLYVFLSIWRSGSAFNRSNWRSSAALPVFSNRYDQQVVALPGPMPIGVHGRDEPQRPTCRPETVTCLIIHMRMYSALRSDDKIGVEYHVAAPRAHLSRGSAKTGR